MINLFRSLVRRLSQTSSSSPRWQRKGAKRKYRSIDLENDKSHILKEHVVRINQRTHVLLIPFHPRQMTKANKRLMF